MLKIIPSCWSQIIFHLESESPNLEKINILSDKFIKWRSELYTFHKMMNRKVDIFEMEGQYFAFLMEWVQF
ncbi:MAG: hypothetical protein IPO62_04285 [Saprospiraceae bacterium]|nr:hypothetical protein [Saprospiraceae bacterium]